MKEDGILVIESGKYPGNTSLWPLLPLDRRSDLDQSDQSAGEQRALRSSSSYPEAKKLVQVRPFSTNSRHLVLCGPAV